MPMYRGLMDLVHRGANHPIFNPQAVYEGDHFTYTQGLTPTLDHDPATRKDGAKLTHVYNVATFADGRKTFRVMTRAEVEACRGRSKARGFTPWQTDYEGMALKTVIRQHVKYLPMSAELQTAVGLDDIAESGGSQQNDILLQSGPIHTKRERVEAKMGEAGAYDPDFDREDP